MQARATNADSTSREVARVCLFVAPGEHNSRLAEDNARRLLCEHLADPGDLQVIDALADPSAATAVGVASLPTLVVEAADGQRLLPGSLTDDAAVLDAFAGTRAETGADAILGALLRGEIDAVLGRDGPLLMRPLAEERSLRESRRRLETLAHATFEGVAITEQGRYLDVNPQMAAMFGYRPDEMTGMEVANLIAPEDRERVMAIVLRGIEGVVEFRARRKDGSTFSAESQSRMLVHEGRRIRVSAIRDVTARKTAERERERLLSQMRGIIASMNEGLVIADASGHVLEMNPAALAMHGYTSAEQVRRHVADFTDTFELFDLEGEPLPVDRWPLARVLQGETFSEVDVRVRRKDSGEEWFGRYGGTAVPDRDGNLALGIVTLRDVTHHIRTEEALRRARDQLEHTVEERTADLGRLNLILQMIIDCNEAIVRAGTEQELLEEVCRIVVGIGGYRMAWVGMAEHDEAHTVRPVASVGFEDGYLSRIRISWADQQFGRGPTGTAIRTGRSTVGDDFLHDEALAPWREEALQRGFRSSVAMPLKNGPTVFGSLTLYASEPHAFDEERVRVLEELAEDLAFGITALRTQAERDEARRAAEERAKQLQALALQLGRAEQEERRRLARLLHDHLQQLLVAARFGVTAIQRRASGDAVGTIAAQVVEALDEAVKAARSLTAELSPTVLHEQGLGAGLKWLADQVSAKHGLTVEVTAEEDAEPSADEVRVFLYESVRELLFNVVKHAGVDRADVHTTVLSDGRIEITVRDEGVGFDPARLWETHDEGAGFGLFGIRERLGFLGGEMDIDSAPGRGSRFILRAPLALERTTGEPERRKETRRRGDAHPRES